MADYKDIAGRIRTTASDGVSLEAQEIFDISKNKKQSQINAETDTTLANHASAIQGLNSQNYVTVAATDQTTAATDVLPATGSADTIYRVGSWDGTQYDETCYSEYSWNGSAYVHISTKTQIGEVFDISLYHATGGTLATYADLAAALGTNGANIPQSLRKGGMSVKYVQSSDNKYVQYRLTADEWSTNTEDWAIADGGVYVENPEYIAVWTDASKKILIAVEKDGNVVFGAGVPRQVIDYVESRISDLKLEDIVTFLGNLITGDKTLQDLLDEKVDKEEGKSLIDAEYANGVCYIENPEFIRVITDKDGKIIEGNTEDGRKEINVPIDINSDEIRFGGNRIYLVDDPEYLTAKIDFNQKVLEGIRKDGVKVINTETELLGSRIKNTDNPEWLRVSIDNNMNILAGFKRDGSFWWGKGIPEHLKEYILKNGGSPLTDVEKAFLNDATMRYPESVYRPVLYSLNRTAIDPERGGKLHIDYKTLTMAVLADIHASQLISNFVEFSLQYNINLSDSIILGDIASDKWPHYDESYDDIPGYHSILKVIGNHDVYDVDNAPEQEQWLPQHYASESQCRQRYMQGIENWGVTGPADVAYYYKDYSDTKIRLIVLDCMHWNTAQQDWFSDVLYGENNPNSAVALGKHVIVAAHIPSSTQNDSKFDFFDCHFYGNDYGGNETVWWQDFDWRERVSTFQEAGGTFVCYMYGHTHQDYVGNYSDYPNQTFIIFPTGSDMRLWTDTLYRKNTDWEDQFTLFSVDTYVKFIRLYRVGSNISRNMVYRKSLLISYEDNNRKIISQN